MDSSSVDSYERGRDYQYYDGGYDSSSVSQYNIDGMSESSEEFYSIYERSSIDSYFDEGDEDDLSSPDFYFYEKRLSLR